MIELTKLRSQIDLIDAELLKLLSKRMEHTIQIRRFKSETEDLQREEQILSTVRQWPNGLLDPKFSQTVFKDIFKESKRLQALNLKLTGFQGEHGAYSEIASKAFCSDWISIPCTEFNDVFDGVTKGGFDYGIVPVENSIEGVVTQVNDLLVSTDLKITGEVLVPVHHCLLTLPDTDYREIKTVFSHPQALGQCHGFLARHTFDVRPYYDTAGAAMMLSKERQKSCAVIASKLSAEIYGLDIVKEGIEDIDSNITRFLIMAREQENEEGDKCSIVFSLAHRSGALFEALKIFSDAGINLTRIESRPDRQDPGNFAFLLDFQGNNEEPRVKEALLKVQAVSSWLKLLGCYNSWSDVNEAAGKKISDKK